MIMLAMEVVLDFRCCSCHHDMGVTLRCEGKGLASACGLHSVASIAVPCPNCRQKNLIYFTPGGKLLRVGPAEQAYEFPEPSYN